MAKDPAFMFYSSDFLTGTLFLSNEQVGVYIRLLCVQHQHGGLIDKVSFNQMIGCNEILRTKFIETDDGFFNERLMSEMVKRQKKSKNLSDNAKKRWDAIALEKQNKSNAKLMPPENEDENDNTSKGKEGVGEKPLGYFEKSKDDQIWLESVCRAIGEPPELWVQKFNDHVTATQEFHATLQKWRQHAVSWIKIQIRTQQQDEQRKPKLTGRERQRDNLETLQRNWSIINGSDPDLAQTG